MNKILIEKILNGTPDQASASLLKLLNSKKPSEYNAEEYDQLKRLVGWVVERIDLLEIVNSSPNES
jgi:hypothetical protein